MRLGAPALSHYAGASKAWLDSFMSQAVSAGYRVDFIPIHFYGENVGMGSDPQGAAAEFIRQLNELYINWGRPI